MIYLEDYDLPVIALNVNTFVLITIYLMNGIIGDVCLVSDVGFWNMANFILSAISFLVATTFVICGIVDIWWISKKTYDNRRWI
jgi:hypothetical protein